VMGWVMRMMMMSVLDMAVQLDDDACAFDVVFFLLQCGPSRLPL
jgi:hypothetical protein